ncbi:metal ABC transporter ATP-binding protein [Kosmotoga pacifica]|uniref:Metal ABC transporter ATP-binding protein n=1 Tax=Kosmotoga pacifica TaxID=1330330 RepID=A0A0G2Z8E1_9BACT|nr:ABC transporter ATP-binding protein [Kosmotoga pacifica]AKI97837.1 metal ABC transporter ATP-binding protein [Kosmotoga pacifica]
MPGDVILRVENLNYSIGRNQILKNISFEINRGEFVGLIGPNGAGKSTLIRAIIGELEGFQGKVEVKGKIGYLPQQNNFERDFPITVRDTVAMGLYKNKGPFKFFNKADWKKVRNLLEMVGVAELSDRRIGVLSGGEYQRVMLARALATDPEILILDEPEAGIDEMGKTSFYKLLNELKKEIELTLLMVSHDIGLVFDACDRIMCLNKTLHCHKSTQEVSPEDLRVIFSPDFDLLIRGKDHLHKEHEL